MNEERTEAITRIRIIAEFGEVYQQRYLYNKMGRKDLQNLLKNDWYEALKFFFGMSFMGGRREELSLRFLNNAIKVLDNFDLKTKVENNQLTENWQEDLSNKLKEGVPKEKDKKGVPKEKDRKMVVFTIKFILDINKKYNYNLINYSLEKIENSQINELYNQLDNITNVGDKKISLFLRDLICIFDLESKIPLDKQIYFQPIDIWVKKIVVKLGIVQESERVLKNIKQIIIQKCNEAKISPIEFNQGAWYIGIHAFDILVENLDNLG